MGASLTPVGGDSDCTTAWLLIDYCQLGWRSLRAGFVSMTAAHRLHGMIERSRSSTPGGRSACRLFPGLEGLPGAAFHERHHAAARVWKGENQHIHAVSRVRSA